MFLNQSDVHKLNPWFRKEFLIFVLFSPSVNLFMLIDLLLKATKGKNKKTEILTSGFNHKMWEDKSVEENYKGFLFTFFTTIFLSFRKDRFIDFVFRFCIF